MKKLLFTTATFALLSGYAYAAEVTGNIEIDFSENAEEKYVADTTLEFELQSDNGVGGISFELDGGNVVVDKWSVGTSYKEFTVSFGDQGDLLEGFEGSTEVVGGASLLDPEDDGESIMLGFAGAKVMVGLTDITTDVTDAKNVQATYGVSFGGGEAGATVGLPSVSILGGFDYNLDAEQTNVFGKLTSTVSDFTLNSTITYAEATEAIGFESDVSAYNFTGFVNGNDEDMVQNIGGGYYPKFNQLGLFVEASYNLDSEEISPAAGVRFEF